MTHVDRTVLNQIITDAQCAIAAIRAINGRADEHGLKLPKLEERPLLEILTHCAVLKHPRKEKTSDVQDPANP